MLFRCWAHVVVCWSVLIGWTFILFLKQSVDIFDAQSIFTSEHVLDMQQIYKGFALELDRKTTLCGCLFFHSGAKTNSSNNVNRYRRYLLLFNFKWFVSCTVSYCISQFTLCWWKLSSPFCYSESKAFEDPVIAVTMDQIDCILREYADSSSFARIDQEQGGSFSIWIGSRLA